MWKGRGVASSSSLSSSGSRVEKATKGRKGVGVDEHSLDELGILLGMSFAAAVAQIWENKQAAGQKMQADRLSMMCVTAVREAVSNVYAEKYEYFLRQFEKSFSSTMKTLQAISGENLMEGEKFSRPPSSNQSETVSFHEGTRTSDCVEDVRENQSQTSDSIEEIHLNQPLSSEYEVINGSSNQERQVVLLSGPSNQQLIPISHGSSQALSQAILTTFKDSVMEQARSNELKTVELGLTLQRMQMKQSELNLQSFSNVLGQAKLYMDLKETQFKEEKLKNQMKDIRLTEFIGSCTDFLLAGLIIMWLLLGYAAWVFSYTRIWEATESCIPSPKESKSWWMPKQVSALNSTLLFLKCHAAVMYRLFVGISLPACALYLLYQRSAGPRSMMPVTFIIIILGIVCGIAGKLCIDTLGGDGYHWLVYWESFCFAHFSAHSFPSSVHSLLYGQVHIDQKPKLTLVPYLFRRVVFYGTLILVPILGGLLPFASFHDWKEHVIDLVMVRLNLEESFSEIHMKFSKFIQALY